MALSPIHCTFIRKLETRKILKIAFNVLKSHKIAPTVTFRAPELAKLEIFVGYHC